MQYISTLDYVVLKNQSMISNELQDFMRRLEDMLPRQNVLIINQSTALPLHLQLQQGLALHQIDSTSLGKNAGLHDTFLKPVEETISQLATVLDDELIWQIPEVLWPNCRNQTEVLWFVSLLLPPVVLASGRVGCIAQSKESDLPQIRLAFGHWATMNGHVERSSDVISTLCKGAWYYIVKLFTEAWLMKEFHVSVTKEITQIIRRCIFSRFIQESGVRIDVTSKFHSVGQPLGAELYEHIEAAPLEDCGEILVHQLQRRGLCNPSVFEGW